MSRTDHNVMNYDGALPLAQGRVVADDARDVQTWMPAPLPPVLNRGLLALAIVVLLISAASFAIGGLHVSKMPDSFGREQQPQLWQEQFYKQRTWSHIALLCLAGGLSLIALARWERTVRVMRMFWLGIAHPLNLAVYRIVLFSTILFNLDDDCNRQIITFFAGLSRKLYVPPTGMEHILPWLPVNPTLANWALTLMNVFCITAILGLFSRTSAALVLLLGVYALGIPQYFGQCNHYHHMFWFAAMMVVSPIGDYFSIDAILAARKRAAKGITEPPAPARRYSLPLRCVMVLLSMCYFFPGLWKYWVSGLAWAWSDNFKHLMEWKWINMGEQEFGTNFTPLFRLDHYPWMYKPSAMIALVFEMSFGVLIFFPRARYLAVMMGVGFHRMIAFMMRIPFYTLQTSYAAFFNWRAIFTWLGRKLIKQPMVVSYDGGNVNACKAVATLRALDLFGRVDYVNEPAYATDGASTRLGDATFTGVAALYAAANRNPILWVLYPLRPILLPNPAENTGQPAADQAFALSFLRRGVNYGIIPIAVMFFLVFTPNFFLGARRQYHAWPFACYPLFEKVRGHYKEEFGVQAFDAKGQEIPWDEVTLMRLISKPRYSTMCRHVRENKKPEQLQAFWEMLVKNYPQLHDAKSVKFIQKKMYSAPERWTEPPLEVVTLGQAEVRNGTIEKVKMDPSAVAKTVSSTSAVSTTTVQQDE